MLGITILLHERTQTGTNELNEPVYSELIAVEVENVLVSPLGQQEVIDTMNLTGRKAVYQLGIPKGDSHVWEGNLVEFFGETWRVIGKPIEGIDALIPLEWNKKVQVESMYGK